ncbi:hypothetical protein Tco_1238921 [Tanacetum coccineum]
MTLTGAWKKEIWLKGLLVESEYELSLVVGIPIGALVKGGSRSEVPAQVEGAAYRSKMDVSLTYLHNSLILVLAKFSNGTNLSLTFIKKAFTLDDILTTSAINDDVQDILIDSTSCSKDVVSLGVFNLFRSALVRRSQVEARFNSLKVLLFVFKATEVLFSVDRYLQQREVSRGSFSVHFPGRSGRYTAWATRLAGVFGFVGFLDKEHNQGTQGDHEAEVFQVSNDDTAVAQRWLDASLI